MLGFRILIHSIRMVLGNIKEALQISLVPASLALLIFYLLAYLVLGPDVAGQLANGKTVHYGSGYPAPPPGFALFFLPVMVIGGLVVLWILVSWHRFILLEEYPRGWIPRFRFDRVMAYLGHSLMLLIVGLIVGVVVLLANFVILTVLPSPFAVVSMVVGWLVTIVIIYRFLIVLPATAIGRPLTMTQAWEATAGATVTVIVLLLSSLLFQFLIQFVFALFAQISVIGPLLVLVPSVLVLPLINVSILTTMYGVFIEGREID